MTTLLIQPLPHYSHFVITATLLLWPPHYGHFVTTATSLLWPLCYYGHIVITATSLLRLLHYFGHFIFTATSLLLPLCYFGHFVITATLFWPKQKLGQSFYYFKNPFYTANMLIQPDFCGPLETRLTGFHCIMPRND